MFDTRELSFIAAAVCTGVVLGGLYFGGLWWTVRSMPSARHPMRFYFASLVVRLAIALTAFYGILTYAGWPQLVASLAGAIVARSFLVRVLTPAPSGSLTQREAA